MGLEVFGVLLELAAHLEDGRHDLLDVAFQLRRDAVVGGLERRVDGVLAQGNGTGQGVEGLGGVMEPTLFSADTKSQNIWPLRTASLARMIS